MSGTHEVVVVVGTRPELIKMAPVLRVLRAAGDFETYLVHTNQHYDTQLSDVFFENLDIPAPDANLDIGSDSHARQTAAGLVGVERIVEDRDPAVVLAQGDTNAVLSAALAASKLPVLFGHVEAGIRSHDPSMPEEINRAVADRVADLLFAPTERAASNLAAEQVTGSVSVTGNTIVDACREHADFASDHSDILERLDLHPGQYVVATIHRPRNTDDEERLRQIVRALDTAEFTVVLPAHPRTAEALEAIEYTPSAGLRVTSPLDYFDFLELENNARVIVTDSGGVQEEAAILQVPCLTVRPNTERPETVEAGVNVLVEPEELASELRAVYGDAARRESMVGHPDLYGDGTASEQIRDRLRESLPGGDSDAR